MAYPFLQVFISALSFHSGVSAQDAGGTFSVPLRRQVIPLHSIDGYVQHKSAYFGNIHIGGPKEQQFTMVFDTGSAHVVVPSVYCRSSVCMRHKRYRRSASKWAKDIDVDGTPVLPGSARDQITVTFGTGEVGGVLVTDALCLGSPQQPSTSVQSPAMIQKKKVISTTKWTYQDTDETTENKTSGRSNGEGSNLESGCVMMNLITATTMTDDPFSMFEFDGVFGLALPLLSQSPEFNFVHAAAESASALGVPDNMKRIFSVFLAKQDSADSEISFGGWKNERIMPGQELRWNHVTDPEMGYWQVEVLGISIDGKMLEFCHEGCRAIVDTGTSLIAVPTAYAMEMGDLLYHKAKDGDCTGPGPRLAFHLTNFTVVLDPLDYARVEDIQDRGDGDNNDVEKQKDDEDHCVAMLMSLDLPPPFSMKTFILGEPVLQRYYAAFDGLAHQIGFAPSAQNSKSHIISI